MKWLHVGHEEVFRFRGHQAREWTCLLPILRRLAKQRRRT